MSATVENKSFLPSFISLLLVIALGVSLAILMWLVIKPQPKLTLETEDKKIVAQTIPQQKIKIDEQIG